MSKENPNTVITKGEKMLNELKLLIGENEKILYEGKPDKKCFIFESIFNPLMPFALLWFVFDSLFFSGFLLIGDGPSMLFIIPFLLIHMMPVWIYLGGVILTVRKYNNINYVVTDNAIYVSSGVFSKNFNSKPFAEMSHVDLKRGVFDQMFDVGDIIVTSNQYGESGQTKAISINSIKNYAEIYNLVKKLQKDISSDILFPNDLRPKENHGYNTKYKGE